MKFNEIVAKVVSTIRVYEKGFTSVKRTPVDYQVRITSLSEFIEFRLNFEAFKMDSLRSYEELMDGYLFKVDSLENEDGNSFSKANISLGIKPEYMSEEIYNNLINSVIKEIGGNTISFTSDRNNLNLLIEII